MHVHLHAYIHTKHFSMPLENFILMKRRETINSERRSSVTRRSRVAIAASNKQLPTRPSNHDRWAGASCRKFALGSKSGLYNDLIINNSLTLRKLQNGIRLFCSP